MKSAFLRVFVLIIALAVFFCAALPALTESADNGSVTEALAGDDDTGDTSAESDSSAGSRHHHAWPTLIPWPPAPVPEPPTSAARHRRVSHPVESIIESTDATGYATTTMNLVNVRSQASIYSSRVAKIRARGTEVLVTVRAKNSSGEIWFAVTLANGTMGYIRSDLLNTAGVVILEDTANAAEPTPEIIYVTPEPTPEPTPTPQVIYLEPEPAQQPTPTPRIIYVTPEPAAQAEPSPQIVYVTPEPAQPNVTPQVIIVYQDKENG